MPTPIVMRRELSAPAERVFDALSDHANMGRWLGAKLSLIKPAGPGGVGAIRRLHLGFSTIDEEIVESVAPHHIVYTIVRGLFPLTYHRGEINVAAIDATRASVEWQIAIDSKIPLLAPIVRAALKAAITKGLKRLDKQLAS